MTPAAEANVLADLEAQGTPDAAYLARAASDLNLDDADIQDADGKYDPAKIRHLAEKLLSLRLEQTNAADTEREER